VAPAGSLLSKEISVTPMESEVLAVLRLESRRLGHCWYSPKQLAAAIGDPSQPGRSQVQEALLSLERQGAIKRGAKAWTGKPVTHTIKGKPVTLYPAGYNVWCWEVPAQ
jgi:hypothetical protein